MSKRTPYVEEIRGAVKSGMLTLPTTKQITEDDEYHCVRVYCAEQKLNIKTIGLYKLVALKETIRLGIGTNTQIVQNIFNCNNVFEMQKRYK